MSFSQDASVSSHWQSSTLPMEPMYAAVKMTIHLHSNAEINILFKSLRVPLLSTTYLDKTTVQIY